MDNQIERFIEDLEFYSSEQAHIVKEVRQIYGELEPQIGEKFIYGGIGFFLNDQHIGGVYGNKKHVSVVFSRGNELSDPEGFLEGSGKYRRHIKAFAKSDVVAKNVRFFVEQAIDLESRYQ
ncbi:DUF1801 domain-containing protein [Chloroflexi bacterium TSY]|nr:DUF1801 domain-containing protein [Chloroflexi bacterium TSY]